MATVTLKPGREKSLLRHHPWIFSGAIAENDGSPGSGETVRVQDAQRQPLGWGAYSPQSQIAVRMWTFEPETQVDGAFLAARLEQAISARAGLAARPDLDAYRLVYAE